MAIDRVINLLLMLTPVEMMSAIGLGVAWTDLSRIFKDWRAASSEPLIVWWESQPGFANCASASVGSYERPAAVVRRTRSRSTRASGANACLTEDRA
ncbi:MAG: hypothetical protein B7Z55_17495 [Planctomycetales bacterium 12-60-4]|nr:MAG: hypothetical protein B7Z55_17495 [Planctomycetales bacterium 12-60-4]